MLKNTRSHTDRGLDYIRSVTLVQLRIEILDLFTGKLLMLTQVEIRTAMYTLHFLESERHLELDIRSGVSVVSQLLMIVITILLISQAKSLMPF